MELSNPIIDPDTKLYNALYFEARLDEEIARARRHSTQASLVVLGLDDTDRCNSLSDQQRQTLLEKIAEIIRRETRSSDVPARLGDYTFAFLLPYTDANGAKSFVVRLIRALKEASGFTASAVIAGEMDAEPATMLLEKTQQLLFDIQLESTGVVEVYR